MPSGPNNNKVCLLVSARLFSRVSSSSSAFQTNWFVAVPPSPSTSRLTADWLFKYERNKVRTRGIKTLNEAHKGTRADESTVLAN